MICVGLAAQAEPHLRLTTNLIWQREEPWFGGFSGIEIGAGGTQVTLLTDRRTLITGHMVRREGQLTGMRVQDVLPIRHANHKIVRNVFADSEGLAIGADGIAYVSFENATRVAQISTKTGVTKRLPDYPAFGRMKANKGLEALAIHPNGALYTMPERTPAHRKTIPLYAFDGKQWHLAHQIPRAGPFMSVGADFDDKGRFYLLERALTPLGFRSRIRRFDLNAPRLGEITLLTTKPGFLDNMEALTVWKSPEGDTRLTLIADDNFRAIQRTQIVELSLIHI